MNWNNKNAFFRFMMLLLSLAACRNLYAQKYQHIFVSDENINTFSDWRELGFARKIVNNRNWHLSLMHKIDRYQKYDSLEVVKMIDSLASLKMDQGFHFLADLCCRYIDYSRKNNLTRMAWILNHYGGPQALNKYYLADSIAPRPNDPNTFHAEVYHAIRAKHGIYMSWSYYFKKVEKPAPLPPLPKEIQKELENRSICDSALLINDYNVNDINSPWQIFGLNQNSKTKLDTLVQKLLNPPVPSDSVYFSNLVEKLISLKTPESNCLVYNLFFRPIVIDDLNQFNQLQAILFNEHGFKMLNKYYLYGEVNPNLPFWEFALKVREKMLPQMPECYYCKPKSGDQLQIEAMKKVDTRNIDKMVTQIINKNSNLDKIGGYLQYKTALDSILAQVLRIENVTDAIFDFCQAKIDIYPGHETLGIVIYHENFSIQKCYPIQIGQFGNYKLFGKFQGLLRRHGSLNRLVFDPKNIYYKPGFVYEERNRCEEMK